jgi:hypothetical protein
MGDIACFIPDARGQPKAALVLVLHDTVDLNFNKFDCQSSAYPRHTGFAFAVAELDFPSPLTAIAQSNNGVFHSLMFHRIISPAKKG